MKIQGFVNFTQFYIKKLRFFAWISIDFTSCYALITHFSLCEKPLRISHHDFAFPKFYNDELNSQNPQNTRSQSPPRNGRGTFGLFSTPCNDGIHCHSDPFEKKAKKPYLKLKAILRLWILRYAQYDKR